MFTMRMPVSNLLELVDTANGILVQVRWKGIPHSEDTLEPLVKVSEDVPHMLLRFLVRKNTDAGLANKVRLAITF